MEDIIDIIVTETTNLIEITSQPTDEVIDVNIIDNREDIVLNVTPTVVEININSLTGNFGVNWGDIDGTLSNQTDLQNALNLKADLVDGKVPSSQLPSYVDDIIEVSTYSALPTTGETGKIYVVLDTNLIYRWSGSAYIEIKDSSAVWGAITGTLSSQTDLQNALNAKVPYTGATGNVNLGEYGATVGYLGFDTTPSGTPTGIGTMYWDSANRTVSLIDGDGDTTLQLGQEERVLVHNNTGSTLTDGQVVYVTGSTGELPSVALAVNTSDSTSSVTFGIVTESIAHGADGFITTSGIVHGLNTNAFTEGSALWLGSTAGTFTETKPVAPAHAVLVGYVIKKSGGNGSIFVKIQNGYELDELHDVLITSKANNDGLFYESSSGLWKNKSIATVLGYTPVQGTGDTGYYARWTSAGVLSDGFIQTTSNITYVEGMGLSTLNGLDITGNYGAGGGGLKIRSYDETTGNAYIDFANTGGRFYLGVNRSTASGLMTNATAYATVLTTGLGTTNLELGTNATKRLTIDGTTGAVTLTSALSGTSATFSGLLNLDNATSLALSINSSTNNPYIRFQQSGATKFFIGERSAVSGDGGTGYDIYTTSGNDLRFFVGASKALTLATTGAATFSSSVTATDLLTINGSSSGQLLRLNSKDNIGDNWIGFYQNNGTRQGYIGYGFSASNVFEIYQEANEAILFSTAATERMRITSAGNVGIGTTAPDYKFTVSAAASNYISIDNTSNNYRLLLGAESAGTALYSRNLSTNAAIDMRFVVGTSEAMRITSGGNVLINTTSSSDAKFIADGDSNGYSAYFRQPSIYAGSYRIMRWFANGNVVMDIGSSNGTDISFSNNQNGYIGLSTNGSERMRIGSLGFTASVRTASDADSKTFMNSIGSSCGLIPTQSGTTLYLYSRDGSTNYRALLTSSTYFTGQHGNKVKDLDLKENIENYIGMIVSSDGTYYSVNPITKEVTTGKDAISISEALPEIRLSSKDKDKSVWGVVTNVKNDNYNTDGSIDLDNNPSFGDRLGDNVIRVNGLGEGAIWVTNINGNLENGDYICSSIIPGFGRKQDDDLLHNYSVAKITMDCDFDLNNNNLYRCEEFEFEGQTYKKAFVGCTYHCS